MNMGNCPMAQRTTPALVEISLLQVWNETGVADWSLLTIFLTTDDAWWRHESQTEAGPGRSLPHVWSKTGREM
jgi:hypothetical protein